MPPGDDAAAAGLQVFDGNEDANTIYVLLNIRGDDIAHVIDQLEAIDWATITGKPATFPPSAHNHDASNITSGTIARPVSTTGTVNGSSIGVGSTGKGFDGAGNAYAAQVNASGHIYSPAGRATPVVTSYVSAYFNSDGRLGADPSAARFKRDIKEYGYTLEQLLAIEIVTYRLRAAVDELGDDADTLVGVIAEQLMDIGLGEFVSFDDDGQPFNVAYDRLALLAIGALQGVAAQLESIEARLTALEGGA